MGLFGISLTDLWREHKQTQSDLQEVRDMIHVQTGLVKHLLEDVHTVLKEQEKLKELAMATNAQVIELASKQGAAFGTIVNYLAGLKAQLEAANEAANIDLGPLIEGVGQITAFADGLNPATPAPVVDAPPEVPPAVDEGGEPVSEPAPVEVVDPAPVEVDDAPEA